MSIFRHHLTNEAFALLLVLDVSTHSTYEDSTLSAQFLPDYQQ